MLARFLKRLRGRWAQTTVSVVVESFKRNSETLDTAIDRINDEITSNAVEQWILEDRNSALRKDRRRAIKLQEKLAEFVV